MSELRVTLGRNIREARERLGLRQADLAQVIDAKSSQIVSEIEKGSREVKAWELSRIARALRIEMADLLSGRPLVTGDAPLWRKGGGAAKGDTEARLRQRSQRYHRLMELTGSLPTRTLPGDASFALPTATYRDAEKLAGLVVQEMGLGATPATVLFEVLEAQYGVMLFYQDLGEDGSAVSVRAPFGLAMLLNSREPPWRRNFSCAHELFHLLTWESVPRGQLEQDAGLFDQVEELAEAFASALLLPRAPLLAELARVSQGEPIGTPQLIALARRFGVSTSALLWRMRHLKLITEAAAKQLLGDGGFLSADRSTMTQCWWTPPDLPGRYVELAFIAYGQGKVSRARLAELLETDLTTLPRLLGSYGLNLECNRVSEAEIAYS